MFMNLDGSILLWIQEYIRCDFLTPLMKGFSFLGNVGWIWLLIIAVMLCFKKTRKTAFCALVAMGICFLIVNVGLKNAVARIRPYEKFSKLSFLVKKPVDFSFPSGHTAHSFAVAAVFSNMLEGKKGKLFYVLAVFISFSRLYVGVHYPTDVIGGALIGWTIGKIVSVIGKRQNMN